VNQDIKRPLPLLTASNRFFWTAGAEGKLRFKRCVACHNIIHPPVPVCGECLGREQEIVTVSGRATLAAVTVNHQMWMPAFPPPYVIGIVEIEEQENVRLTTNIINCAEADLKIGMQLQVDFEHCEDVYLPVFKPLEAGTISDEGER